ncbi:hypothetical protein C8Q74DRAFT_730351 [Fomes fomentarius]|nr:hypothetical protein C8Q74DRAFT_730351 [Fomes fomentarius]
MGIHWCLHYDHVHAASSSPMSIVTSILLNHSVQCLGSRRSLREWHDADDATRCPHHLRIATGRIPDDSPHAIVRGSSSSALIHLQTSPSSLQEPRPSQPRVLCGCARQGVRALTEIGELGHQWSPTSNPYMGMG